jgi:beta-phosphoglucomutase family hydrolase
LLKAVIFDMDGVIIDSEPFYLVIGMELYKKLNINITKDEHCSFTGVSNTNMWTIIKNNYGLKETVNELVAIQNKANIEYLEENIEKPIPGVMKILESLRKNEIKIALASSSSMEIIRMVLEKLKVTEYFQAIESGENLEKSKPAPDIFLNAAEMLQVEPECCIVIEDSNHGVTAAKAAGMKCIGFQNPNSGNQNLEAADLIVDSLEELNLDIIKKL